MRPAPAMPALPASVCRPRTNSSVMAGSLSACSSQDSTTSRWPLTSRLKISKSTGSMPSPVATGSGSRSGS